MSTQTAPASIGAAEVAECQADGFVVFRQVFSPDRIEEQRSAHYTEFRGWLQDRYAEYGQTATFFR